MLGQTFCIFFFFFFTSFHRRGHKEFTCCSCTLWMYRPLRCLPLHQAVLPIKMQPSSCRNRMHLTLRTYVHDPQDLWSCSAFLPLSYFFPPVFSSIQLILTACLHFSFSIYSFCSHCFYFFLCSFLFALLFHQSYLCHLHVFSSISLSLVFFSHLCPIFSLRLFLSLLSCNLESSRSAPLQLTANLWEHLFPPSSLGFFSFSSQNASVN